MEIDCQPQRAIADLRALADLTGGPGGSAAALLDPRSGRNARALVREALDELPVEIEVDEAGNVWARLRGARAPRRSSSARTSTRCRTAAGCTARSA